MNDNKLQLIEDVLGKEYDYEKYLKFIVNFLKNPRIFNKKRDERIWLEYKKSISAFYKLGDYTDTEANKLLIMTVELKRGSTVERARSLQRNFISKILEGSSYEGAIVAFYTPKEENWRLSFVRLDYKLTEEGPKLDLTPARRYSYLVGLKEPTHTAQKRLLSVLKDDSKLPTIDEIEDIFSVEKVTNEFFEQYKDKYLQLKEYLEANKEFVEETQSLGLDVEKFAEQFSKKLMGQISFLYFLQKKGWLGVTTLPSRDEKLKYRIIKINDYREIYNNANQYSKKLLEKVFKYNAVDNLYYIDVEVLDNLEYSEALDVSDIFKNTKFDKAWGTGDKQFIRGLFDFCETNSEHNFFNEYLEPFFYEGLNTKRENNYYRRFNCKIPFLNGGLFEPIEGYHWDQINFKIPNSIFSNESEKGRYSDGILDIFDRYNFTMNEAEPLEKEVAVDPEMLGKVFENLLDVESRKSKGAFYTPREIVHFMCQESLINYLSNKVEVPYEDIKQFILHGELIKDADNRKTVEGEKDFTIPKSVFDNILSIDKALENVKIADPAVGSGAFPLGMLIEIVNARQNITEYIIKKDKEEGIHGTEYGEKFIRNWRSAYKIKWDTIKNCIYAVDIEPSAVDITKLRLWLSLVVDQELEKDESPHPLPNLDMNIHVGNSLIDEYEGIKLFDKSILEQESKDKKSIDTEQLRFFFDSDEILKEMFDKQNQYFNEYDESRKNSLKKDIDNLRDQLVTYRLKEQGNIAALNKYNDIKREKSKPYFIWELEFAKVFKDNGGFDIVIGNPPYIDSEEMTKNLLDLRNYCRKRYASAKGNWDIYIVFIEKGINLLKENGVISFIIPNKLIGAKYSESLRKIMIKYSMRAIIDYSVVDVFSNADVYPIVFRLEKSIKRDPVSIIIMESKSNFLRSYKVKNELFYRDIYWDRYITENKETLTIIEKVLLGKGLNTVAKVNGAATVSEAYETKEILEDLGSNIDNENYKKLINTGTIDRYVSLWGVKNTRYIKNSYLNPIVKNEKINKMNNVRFNESNKDKIIIGGMNKFLECFYDSEGHYLAGKSTSIIYDAKVSMYYLLGVLNSKLISFYYKNYFKSLSLKGGYLRIGPPQLKSLPIKLINSSVEDMECYVQSLIRAYCKGNIHEIELYEEKVNRIVYNIYNIDNSEIKIIENEIIY